MTAFAQSFDETIPASSVAANTLDTVTKNFKIAVNERLSLEHRALNSTVTGADDPSNAIAQGRHIPGNVSVCYVGTNAAILLLSGMNDGCIAFDTTNSQLMIYYSGVWTTYTIQQKVFGNRITLTAASFVTAGSWSTTFSDVANMLDQSMITFTSVNTVANLGSGYLYYDLGSVKQGQLFIAGQMKSSAASTHAVLYPAWDYNGTDGVITPIQVTSGLHNTNACATVSGTSYLDFTIISYFYGQYVGVIFYSTPTGYTASIKFSRFDVYAETP